MAASGRAMRSNSKSTGMNADIESKAARMSNPIIPYANGIEDWRYTTGPVETAILRSSNLWLYNNYTSNSHKSDNNKNLRGGNIPKDRSVRLRAMPEQSNDYRVVVFGAGGVGKSSLVLRFVRGTFRENYIPTIEDTYRQVISCNKQVCTLQITDTTGSHQFPAMQRLSISKGHAFILVYSISSRQSLEELKPIRDEIVEMKGDIEGIPVMLVGNKCDEVNREVPVQEGAELAKRWNCAFLETSAKTNHNVKELFQELLQLEKRRAVSLQLETNKSKAQKRRDKLKGKCALM